MAKHVVKRRDRGLVGERLPNPTLHARDMGYIHQHPSLICLKLAVGQ